MFDCPKCENVSKPKCELEIHTKSHEKKGQNYTCDLCDDRFTSKNNLENHEVKEHRINTQSETQLNCNDCYFQANTGPELKKHLNLKQHKASSGVGKSSLGETLKCRDCGEEFSAWWNLLHHRRDVHPEKRRRCRNDIKNECQYTEDTGPNGCWWKHGQNTSKSKNFEAKYGQTCNICNEDFRTKSDVMIHKKNKHEEKVPFCKDLKNGSCTFSRCWYRHKEIT